MKYLGRTIGVAAFSLAVAGAALAEPARDKMADLEALAAQRSWQELGDHLQDIPPAERDAHWQELVEQAALGELAPLAALTDSFVEQLSLLDRYYPTFPSLARSPDFMRLRAKIGLAAYARCFDYTARRDLDAAPCLDHLADFARAEPVDAALARSAAEIVAVKLNQAAAANLYAIALAADKSVCAAPGLAPATVAALGQPVDGADAKAGKALLEACLDPLKDAVLDAFGKESPRSPYLRNACPALMTHSAVSGLRAQRCKDLAGNAP